MNEREKNTNPLGTQNINKLLLKYSVPTMLTLFVNYFYNIVDQIFIGQGIGITGIAATNVAFPLSIICISIALLIGDGCAANISLSLGKNERTEADLTFSNAFFMLFLSSIIIVLAFMFFLKPILYSFGATNSIIQGSIEYSRIIVLGLPFLIFNVSFTAIIRADGNPKYSMKSMIIGAVINLILDPIFIFSFKMGLQGAAIATITGQVVSGLICLLYINKLKNFSLSKNFWRLNFHRCLKILLLGIPSFVTQISSAFVQIVMNNLMSIYGGLTIYGSEIALSCFGIMMKIYQIAHSMFVGVSSGTQPIYGYNFGAKNYSRVRQTYKIAFKVAFSISVLWFLIFQIFPGQLASLFINKNPLYIECAKYSFRIYMMAFFLYGIPMITTSFFQAIGKPWKGLFITVSRQLIFLIPLALILSKSYDIFGALIATPIADLLTFILVIPLVIYEFKLWKRNDMV